MRRGNRFGVRSTNISKISRLSKAANALTGHVRIRLTSRCRLECCYNPAHMEHRDDRTFRAKRPSPGAILLGLIPFAASCFSVPLWDRVYPMVLGLPFNFFWLISWLLLTPLCMWGAYRLETHRASELGRKDGGTP